MNANLIKGESTARTTIRMIVNADDFGYFDQVSRGIIDAAEQGRVTATGVMANGPALDKWLDRLKALPSFSVGVHLNATLGRPLTAGMQQALAAGGGEFPLKGALASSILLGRLGVATVIDEWRAQIQRCLQAGLKLEFLNSHEHVHMLPALYSKVRGLANEFGIANVRAPQPEWGPTWNLGSCLRNGVFTAVKVLVPRAPRPEPVLIGVSPSGKLNRAYCEWRFARLTPGATYELMCHPGWSDQEALRDPRLGAYHDWEGELQTLTSSDFSGFLRDNGIALASYADVNS